MPSPRPPRPHVHEIVELGLPPGAVWQGRVCSIRLRKNTNGGPGCREYGIKAVLAAAEDQPEWYAGSALHRLGGKPCRCQRCQGTFQTPTFPTRDKRTSKKGDGRHAR